MRRSDREVRHRRSVQAQAQSLRGLPRLRPPSELIHAIADDVKHFGDREGVTGSNRAQVEIVVPTRTTSEAECIQPRAGRRTAAGIVVAVDSTIRANEYLL